MKTTFTILLLSLTIFAFAQPNSDTTHLQYGDVGFKQGQQYVITRIDDFEYVGEILSDDGYEVLLKTKNIGEVYIPKYEIKSIIEIKDKSFIIYDDYQPEGSFTTRYSFTTNALPIKKGQNYGMLNLYGPEVHLAVSNKFNVGIMTTWAASPLVLAMKYSFNENVSKVNFSFGSLLGTTGYINGFKGYGGLHWLNVTFGDRKNNLTFSGGYAYLQTGMETDEPDAGVYNEDQYRAITENRSELLKMNQGPIFSVAALFKIGGRASFIFDSMVGYFNYEQVDADSEYNSQLGYQVYTVTRKNAYSTALFIMPGVRFQSTDRKAFQICVAGVSTFGDTQASFPIPMISWFYKF